MCHQLWCLVLPQSLLHEPPTLLGCPLCQPFWQGQVHTHQSLEYEVKNQDYFETFLSRFQPLWFLQRSIRLTLGLSFVWKGWWVALESKGRVMNINDQDGLQRYLRGVTSLWTTFAARKLNPGLTFQREREKRLLLFFSFMACSKYYQRSLSGPKWLYTIFRNCITTCQKVKTSTVSIR